MKKEREQYCYKWLCQQLNQPLWLYYASGLGMMYGGLQIVQSALLACIFSVIVSGEQHFIQISMLIGLVLLLVLKAIVHWLKEWCGFKIGKSVRHTLRKKLLDKIQKSTVACIDYYATGEQVTFFHEHIDQLQSFYAHYLPQRYVSTWVPFIIVGIVFIFSWGVGVIFICTAPLVPLFMVLVGHKAADLNRKNFHVLTRLNHHFVDRLRGLPVLQLFDRCADELKEIAKTAHLFRIQTMRVLRLAFVSSAVLEFFSSISIALTAVYLGMSYLGYWHIGMWGSITLFSGFFLLLLAPEFYQSFRNLGTYYHARAEAIGAADHLINFLHHSTLEETKGFKTIDKVFEKGFSIQCHLLTVTASSGKKLLDNVSFCLDAGEQLVITGPSGSGKSTLLRSLLGFYDYQGSIQINRQELRDLDRKYYHTLIAWMNQNPLIVHGSIDENVMLGSDQVTHLSVKNALDQSCAQQFVDTLPLGRKTILSEGGYQISMGQAQRIALARVLVRPSHLVLLDEPTARLDSDHAHLIDQKLKEYNQERSVIWVTHRLDILQKAHRILLLDQGKIINEGNFNVLKKQSTLFKQLCKNWYAVEYGTIAQRTSK